MNICLKCNRPAASHTINNIRGGQFDSHDPLTREDQYGTANTMLTEWRAATETATHYRYGSYENPMTACGIAYGNRPSVRTVAFAEDTTCVNCKAELAAYLARNA